MAFDKQTGREAGKKSKRGAAKELKELRNVFAELLSNNIDNMQIWFDKTAEENPSKAIELMLKVSSFIISKPRTIELTDTTAPTKENKVQIVFKDITQKEIKEITDKLDNN